MLNGRVQWTRPDSYAISTTCRSPTLVSVGSGPHEIAKRVEERVAYCCRRDSAAGRQRPRRAPASRVVRVDDRTGRVGRAVDAVGADARRRDIRRPPARAAQPSPARTPGCGRRGPRPPTVTVVSPAEITHTGRGIDRRSFAQHASTWSAPATRASPVIGSATDVDVIAERFGCGPRAVERAALRPDDARVRVGQAAAGLRRFRQIEPRCAALEPRRRPPADTRRGRHARSRIAQRVGERGGVGHGRSGGNHRQVVADDVGDGQRQHRATRRGRELTTFDRRQVLAHRVQLVDVGALLHQQPRASAACPRATAPRQAAPSAPNRPRQQHDQQLAGARSRRHVAARVARRRRCPRSDTDVRRSATSRPRAGRAGRLGTDPEHADGSARCTMRRTH